MLSSRTIPLSLFFSVAHPVPPSSSIQNKIQQKSYHHQFQPLTLHRVLVRCRSIFESHTKLLVGCARSLCDWSQSVQFLFFLTLLHFSGTEPQWNTANTAHVPTDYAIRYIPELEQQQQQRQETWTRVNDWQAGIITFLRSFTPSQQNIQCRRAVFRPSSRPMAKAVLLSAHRNSPDPTR